MSVPPFDPSSGRSQAAGAGTVTSTAKISQVPLEVLREALESNKIQEASIRDHIGVLKSLRQERLPAGHSEYQPLSEEKEQLRQAWIISETSCGTKTVEELLEKEKQEQARIVHRMDAEIKKVESVLKFTLKTQAEIQAKINKR